MNHIMLRFTNSAMRAATIFLMAFFVVMIAAMTSAMAADKLADLVSDNSIPADLSVSGVRIGENGPVTRFVLDISQSTPFHVMTIKDPYRVVLTLPSLRWQLLPGLGQMDRGVVKNFRYGSFDHSSFRVVLDLKSAARVDSVKILPPIAADHVANYRLVIDMTAIDKSKFKPQQFGSYQPSVAVAAKPAVPEKQNVDPPVAAKPVVNKADTVKTIILDPGHGGVDPGAIGISKSYEKNITLAAALELKQLLEKKGYKVLLTRSNDNFVKLRDRVKFARDNKADLFISLHADHHNDKSVRGASVYTLSDKGSDAEAERLAEQENKADIIAGFDFTEENEAVSSILIDMAQQETRGHSVYYGNLLVQELQSASGNIIESPLRSAAFAVLKAPDIPSVLVEMGYLSNKKDEAALNKPEYRAKIAAAIAGSVERYFTKIQNSPLGMQNQK